jgi:hypothetical protein
LRHNPRPHDGGNQHQSANGFGETTLTYGEHDLIILSKGYSFVT